MMVNVAGISFDSIVDGPGLRNTLFVQGCSHHCAGCHNPETWSHQTKKLMDQQEILHALLANKNDVTFSGGEPFEQAKALEPIAKILKENGVNLWSYSGYTFEELIQQEDQLNLLKHIDVLVDGRFILEQRSLELKFKGSKNQRIIDVQKSLESNQIVEHHFEENRQPSPPIKLYI